MEKLIFNKLFIKYGEVNRCIYWNYIKIIIQKI